jgi:hypothetical protein
LEQEEVRLKKEAEEKSKREQEEKTNKFADEVIDASTATTIEFLFNEGVEQAINENFILEFIVEKLTNEEINSKMSKTSKLLRDLADNCLREELNAQREEQQRLEKQMKQQLRAQLEEELTDKIFTDTIDSLIRECCERVKVEVRNELINSIYIELADEVVKTTLEKCVLQNIFEEMSGLAVKPLLAKPQPLPPEEDRRKPSEQLGPEVSHATSSFKRRLSGEDTSSVSKTTSITTNTPSKKAKIVNESGGQVRSSSAPTNQKDPSTNVQTLIEEG